MQVASCDPVSVASAPACEMCREATTSCTSHKSKQNSPAIHVNICFFIILCIIKLFKYNDVAFVLVEIIRFEPLSNS